MQLKVGILGGGQLAKMLAEQLVQWGCTVLVYSERPEAPAARFFANSTIGSLHDERALRDFLQKINVVLFENEWVDTALLARAGHAKLRFVPDLSVLSQLQDKWRQKQTFLGLGLPTAEAIPLPPNQSPPDWLRRVESVFPKGYVLKWSMHGYDGKGVLVQKPRGALQSAIDFCQRAQTQKADVYAEQLVPFTVETALVACRSRKGDLAYYPMVVTEQVDSICSRVQGPAERFGIPKKTIHTAQKMAMRLGNALNIVGTYALEFFITSRGNLLINEVAPRVHNSAHFTQDACATSQFENHLRAALELPLGSTASAEFFGMANLVAKGTGYPSILSDAILLPEILGHWYGKGEARPGRKMGHLNAMAESKRDWNRVQKELWKAQSYWESYWKGKH